MVEQAHEQNAIKLPQMLHVFLSKQFAVKRPSLSKLASRVIDVALIRVKTVVLHGWELTQVVSGTASDIQNPLASSGRQDVKGSLPSPNPAHEPLKAQIQAWGLQNRTRGKRHGGGRLSRGLASPVGGSPGAVVPNFGEPGPGQAPASANVPRQCRGWGEMHQLGAPSVTPAEVTPAHWANWPRPAYPTPRRELDAGVCGGASCIVPAAWRLAFGDQDGEIRTHEPGV